jgi:hypothetical protein
MKAIRFEKNGIGPFMWEKRKELGIMDESDYECMQIFEKCAIKHNKMNLPEKDFILQNYFISGIHKCAYRSIKQLLDFIDQDTLHKMCARGFQIKVIEAKDMQSGIDQVCYDPNTIISEEILDIDSILA